MLLRILIETCALLMWFRNYSASHTHTIRIHFFLSYSIFKYSMCGKIFVVNQWSMGNMVSLMITSSIHWFALNRNSSQNKLFFALLCGNVFRIIYSIPNQWVEHVKNVNLDLQTFRLHCTHAHDIEYFRWPKNSQFFCLILIAQKQGHFLTQFLLIANINKCVRSSHTHTYNLIKLSIPYETYYVLHIWSLFYFRKKKQKEFQ